MRPPVRLLRCEHGQRQFTPGADSQGTAELNYENLFDLLVLLLLVAGFVMGYLQGTIRRLLGIAQVLFSLVLAAQIRGPLGDFLVSNWTQFVPEYSRMLAFGLGAWAAALHVQYRDTGIVLPFVLQFGLYLSPVIFPSDLVPYPWRLLYSLNPVVGVIEGFRWASFPNQAIHLPALALSLASAFVFLFAGLRYFRRTERGLADII